MKRRMMFGILAVSCWLCVGAARADDCDQELVDTAGILDSAGTAKVQEAIGKLADAGARVRVRVMGLPPEGDLDRYQKAREGSCHSWQGVDGGRLNTLVSVLYQTKGGRTGRGSVRIFFGSYWTNELDPVWMPVLQNDVAPLLLERQYAAGLAVGIGKLAAAAKAKATAVPSSGKPATVINNAPTDYRGLWTALLYLFLGLLALAAIYGLYSFVVSISRSRAARRAKRQEAQANRDKCASFIVELEGRAATLRDGLKLLASTTCERILMELKATVDAALTAISGPTEDYRSSAETSAANPDREGLSTAEYQGMADRYGQDYAELQAGSKQIAEAEKAMKRLVKLLNYDLPAALTDATMAIKAADVATQKASDAGFRARPLREALAKAVDLNGTAKDLAAQKEVVQAKAAADEVKRIADAVKAAAENLPKKKAALVAAAEAETKRVADMHARVIRGVDLTSALQAEFAETCSKLIRGNDVEASKRLSGAERELGLSKPDLDHGDLAEAEEHIGQARAWLDQADSYLNSIVSLDANLRQAKSSAQSDLDGAQSDIADARSFLETHGQSVTDVSASQEKLAEAAGLLNAAKDELAKAKPDYIFALKQIGKVSAAVRSVLKAAKEDDAAHERKVRQLASLKRDAKSAVSAAREYIQDHSSDVDADAQRNLAKAQAGLKETDAAPGLDAQIASAEAAMKLARKAIKQAEEDVEDRARKRREREYARARARSRSSYDSGSFHSATSVSVFSSSSSDGGFSGWGGGGGGGGFDIGGGGGGGGGGGFDL